VILPHERPADRRGRVGPCGPVDCVKEAWAWWLLAFSGSAEFASFLAYLGYGYLDTWHGVRTALLPAPALTGG
jgi:hypothetical protein